MWTTWVELADYEAMYSGDQLSSGLCKLGGLINKLSQFLGKLSRFLGELSTFCCNLLGFIGGQEDVSPEDLGVKLTAGAGGVGDLPGVYLVFAGFGGDG